MNPIEALMIAFLEDVSLGKEVGYTVRDEDRSGSQTQIHFVTPGVALRLWAQNQLADYGVIVIDEFHERSLEIDLFLALCRRLPHPLVVMSATFAGDRLAEHLRGIHLQGQGRTFEVKMTYSSQGNTEPTGRNLPQRVVEVVESALQDTDDDGGDLLVFLPGKGEIFGCESELKYALSGGLGPHRLNQYDLEILTLHGTQSLEDQSRLFKPTDRRRIVLSTNVAETSLTVPRVTTVIDSGLVRQNRYDRGRGALSLMAVAQDQADQRAGRAGRVQAGRCFRMWAQGASLKAHTPPEMYRGSLGSLVLAVNACGCRVKDLEFVDPPKEFALEEALRVLKDLEALNEEGGLTPTGRAMFELGMDLALSRWLLEGQKEGNLDDIIDLVSLLSSRHSVFFPISNLQEWNDDHSLQWKGCDGEALIRAMRVPASSWSKWGLNPLALQEGYQNRKRLYRAFDLGLTPLDHHESIDRRRLALTLLRADPRNAYVARQRRRQIAWCGIGPDLMLGKGSGPALRLAYDSSEKYESVIVLESHTQGKNARQTESWITLAMPIPLAWLKRAELGQWEMGEVIYKGGKITTELTLTFAKKVLATQEVSPQGEFAQKAIVTCIQQRKLWPKLMDQIEERLFFLDLWTQLKEPKIDQRLHFQSEIWLLERVKEIGIEDMDDLELVDASDFLPEPLDEYELGQLKREFPSRIELSDAHYKVEYDVAKKRAVLHQVSGSRRQAPLVSWLPKCGGFEIKLKQGQHASTLRPRRR